MKITINGKSAVLKKDTSFEFVAENRSFTGSDSYTLSITFPLRGCLENLVIFGHINRADVDKSKVVFDCELQDINFYKSGIITIVEISDIEVKTQFLEGRSEQNFNDTFDEIYINELDLGSFPITYLPEKPTLCWGGLNSGQEAVALPWVNNASGNIQNNVVFENNSYSYHSECSGLSFQPYLIVIVSRICSTLGYSCDVSQWNDREDLRYLLVCNTLPWAWNIPQFARALPHWSVTEFFEKLEHILGGEFDIDHKAKTIKFAFYSNALAAIEPVMLENVIDEYSAEVTTEDESNYFETANCKFKECSHNMWKFYSCLWFVQDNIDNRVEYDTLDDLIAENRAFAVVRWYARNANINRVLYARDVDMHFIIRCVRNEYVYTDTTGKDVYNRICVLQPINVFGDKIVNELSNNNIELDFVPAWIDETDRGNCLFLDIEGFDESALGNDEAISNDETVVQPAPMQQLVNGTSEDKTEYFDKIYLAFWDGSIFTYGKLPCPIIDWITIREDWTFFVTRFSMRFTKGAMAQSIYNINPKQKFQFSFIANSIPNVRALFFINGKRYLCEKITATFTENGMSQLMKGNFYLVTE